MLHEPNKMNKFITSIQILSCLLGIIIYPVHTQYSYCTLEPLPVYNFYNTYKCNDYDKTIVATCKTYVDFSQLPCTEYVMDDFYYRKIRREIDNYHLYIINIEEPKDEDFMLIKHRQEVIALTVRNGNFTTLFNSNIMRMLESLTISGNKIDTVLDVSTFENFPAIERISLTNNRIYSIRLGTDSWKSYAVDFDVSYNLIEVCPYNFLKQFGMLENLNMSHNMISSMKSFALSKLENLKSLDMSYNKLSVILNYSFIKLFKLKHLDLSSNNIQKLYTNSFAFLNMLKSLDLGQNKLDIITKNVFSNLTMLESLNLGHNKLQIITKEHFHNNTKLRSISLVNNRIVSIEVNAFTRTPIKELKIQNNYLTGEINKGIFGGLDVSELDLGHQNIKSINDFAFENMFSLKALNLSSNVIENIQPLAFLALVTLKVLDLSHNQLKEINYESTAHIQLTELYADHNNIERINRDTFINFVNLQELDLSYNNIIELEPHSVFNKLSFLKLSFNNNMKMLGNPFQNVTQLKILSLQNVKVSVSFDNSSASIKSLELQSCGITDINKLFIFNVQNIAYLNLSMNEITNINRNSFRNMSTLVSLDLSLNMITLLQPGSFRYLKRLTFLNFYGNKLSTINFGDFDGLQKLQELNLSRNMLHIFDVKLFPAVTKLSLDDNVIVDLSLTNFYDTNISELSLAGNRMPCKMLVELYSPKNLVKSKRIKTAKTLNFYTENVNGVPCFNAPYDTARVNTDITNSNTNFESLRHLLDVIDNINLSLQSIAENTIRSAELLENVIKT